MMADAENREENCRTTVERPLADNHGQDYWRRCVGRTSRMTRVVAVSMSRSSRNPHAPNFFISGVSLFRAAMCHESPQLLSRFASFVTSWIRRESESLRDVHREAALLFGPLSTS